MTTWRNRAACLDENPELFSRLGTLALTLSRSNRRRGSATAA